MVVATLCFIAGCAIGAFLTVWPVAAISSVALIIALGLGLTGTLSWAGVFGTVIFPTMMFQGGAAVALFARAAFDHAPERLSRRGLTRPGEQAGDASNSASVDLRADPPGQAH